MQAHEGSEHGGYSAEFGAVRVVFASEDMFMHYAVRHCATRKKDVRTHVCAFCVVEVIRSVSSGLLCLALCQFCQYKRDLVDFLHHETNASVQFCAPVLPILASPRPSTALQDQKHTVGSQTSQNSVTKQKKCDSRPVFTVLLHKRNVIAGLYSQRYFTNEM